SPPAFRSGRPGRGRWPPAGARARLPPNNGRDVTMQQRPLGKTGLTVPPVVVGGNVFGWTVDAAASFDLLDRCLDAGLTAIDTADSYSTWVPGNSGGDSETIIGDWMESRGCRDRVTLITKVGSPLVAGGKGPKNLSADYIARAADASLRRLKT